MFKTYFFVLQKVPFRLAKWPILEAKKHHIAPWNGLFRNAKWAISESETHFFGLWYRVYEKPVCPETASDTPYLTSIHTSFAKIFCQNRVKKNCKLIAWVSFKRTDIILKIHTYISFKITWFLLIYSGIIPEKHRHWAWGRTRQICPYHAEIIRRLRSMVFIIILCEFIVTPHNAPSRLTQQPVARKFSIILRRILNKPRLRRAHTGQHACRRFSAIHIRQTIRHYLPSLRCVGGDNPDTPPLFRATCRARKTYHIFHETSSFPYSYTNVPT